MTTSTQRQTVSLNMIDIYGGTQTRVATNDDAIESYAEEMANGALFPAVTLFYDGSTYWLADGFHRCLAIKRNGGTSVEAEVQPGGRTDALKYALGANATHGLYRNNADKRRAAQIAVTEWSDRSNAYLAEICHVSIELVRTVRTELTQSGKIEQPDTVTGRDGKEYPTAIERQPRGKTEGASADEAGGGGESGGGGGGAGRPSAKGDGGAPGGSINELEAESRSMIRKGDMNPFELPKLMSANAHDYAATVITLLGTMKPDDSKRREGLLRIKRWVDAALAGDVAAES